EFDMPELTVSGTSRAPNEHAAVSSMFSAIGLKPKTQKMDFNQYWPQWTSRSLPCWVFVWSTPTTPWIASTAWDKFTTGYNTSGLYVDSTVSPLAKSILNAAATGDKAQLEKDEATALKHVYAEY